MGTEECYECGGAGGVDAATFGDTGWHACYKCLATGRLPLGTRADEYNDYAEECCFRDCGDGDRSQYDGDWEGVPAVVVAPHGDSDLPF